MKKRPRIIYSSELTDRMDCVDPYDFRDELDSREEEDSPVLAVRELSLQAILAVARSDRKEVSIAGETYSRQDVTRALKKLCCDPRRIVALMLYAADHPDWAWVNFWKTFCPEMTNREMAALRRINPSTVKYHLDNVELPADAYEFIPENR